MLSRIRSTWCQSCSGSTWYWNTSRPGGSSESSTLSKGRGTLGLLSQQWGELFLNVVSRSWQAHCIHNVFSRWARSSPCTSLRLTKRCLSFCRSLMRHILCFHLSVSRSSWLSPEDILLTH